MRKLLIAVAVIFALLVATIIETSAQTIHGCYSKKNGVLRIITGSQKCSTSETPISWNQTGPQGQKGDTGAIGPAGPAGPAGPQGPAGTVSQEVLDAICQLAIQVGISPCPNFCTCYRLVFLSSTTYTGDLGGLTGADAKCNALASAAAIRGTFKAWLSDSTGASPHNRFVHGTDPYVLVDGRVLALNWQDLTDGVLLVTPNVDEYGNPHLPPPDWWADNAWTGTRQTGECATTDPDLNCYDWTTDTGSPTYPYYPVAVWGDPHVLDSTWSHAQDFVTCNGPHHLYCFQQ